MVSFISRRCWTCFLFTLQKPLCSLLGKIREKLSDYFANNPNYFLLDPSEVFNYANLLSPLYFVHRTHMFYVKYNWQINSQLLNK